MNRIFKNVALMLALLAAVATAASAAGKHEITFEDLEGVKSPESLEISPDGRSLAYTVDGKLFVVSTRAGSSARALGDGYFPQWSPDSKQLVFYRGAAGGFQLWLADAATLSASELTQVPDGINPNPWTVAGAVSAMHFSWSPDGRRIVFTSQVPMEPAAGRVTPPPSRPVPSAETGTPLILDRTTPADWTLHGVFQQSFDGGAGWIQWQKNGMQEMQQHLVDQLFILDVQSKALTQLTKDTASCFQPQWMPDGARILCASTEGEVMDGWAKVTSNIYAVDARSGQKTALTHGDGVKRLPSPSPDGQWVTYLGSPEFLRKSVHMIPASGGEPRVLTSVTDRNIDMAAWNADSKTLTLLVDAGVHGRSLAQLDVASGRITERAIGLSYLTTLATHTGAVAWHESGPAVHGAFRVLPAGSRKSHVAFNLNPQIADWNLGQQEVFRWKTASGEEHEGVLIKPAGYQPGRTYPVIIDAYPGQGNYFKSSTMMGNQAWAAQGYAVFLPNARAPHVWMNPFLGAKYDNAARGPDGWEVTLSDFMSGVDALVASGIADPDRMCLYGFSNGGGTVNYVVTRTTRFKCAVSAAGALSDWARPALLNKYARNLKDFAGGDLVWDNPEGYVKLSAVYRLKYAKTPMLISDGDADDDFLLDSIEMYNGLRYYGVDVTLLRYSGQEHVLKGPAMKDFWTRALAFFAKHLRPGES